MNKKMATKMEKNVKGSLIFACVACALAATFLAALSQPVQTRAEEILEIPVYPTPQQFTPRLYGSPLTLSIKDDGKLKLEGVRIEKVAGTNFFAKMQWGLSILRVTIRTDATTQVTKKMGQSVSLKDIKEGDYISLEGEFVSGTTSFDVLAKKIKNWSMQTEEMSFAGTVINATTTVASSSASFIVNVPKIGLVTYALPADLPISKGSITVNSSVLVAGTRITSSIGIYDHFTKIFRVTSLRIYQDMSQFEMKNWEGAVKTIISKEAPIRLTVTVKGKEYTVELNADAKVLSKNQKPALFSRFVEGDVVRFAGRVQESDTTLIKATLIRNLGL